MSFSINISTSTPRAVMASTPTRCVTSPSGTRPLACGLPWIDCMDIPSPPHMPMASEPATGLGLYTICRVVPTTSNGANVDGTHTPSDPQRVPVHMEQPLPRARDQELAATEHT